MRLQKNKQLSLAEWEACIDELISLYDIRSRETAKRKSKLLTHSQLTKISVSDLCYLFMTATKRKLNHVYITKEQDRMYDNISFYQDPYWHKKIHDPETRRRLEEQLKECRNEWKN
jgi:hypothetical protein